MKRRPHPGIANQPKREEERYGLLVGGKLTLWRIIKEKRRVRNNLLVAPMSVTK